MPAMFIPGALPASSASHVAVPRARLENLNFQLHRLGDMLDNMLLEAETPAPRQLQAAPRQLQAAPGSSTAAPRPASVGTTAAPRREDDRRSRGGSPKSRTEREDDRRSRSRRRSSVRAACLDVPGAARHTPRAKAQMPFEGAASKSKPEQPAIPRTLDPRLMQIPRPSEDVPFEERCHYFQKQGFDGSCLEWATHGLVMFKASPKYRWTCANCGTYQIENGVAQWDDS